MTELSPDQRRALFFLARQRRTVAEIAAQGIKGDVLSGLVKAGLARKVVEKVGRGVLTTEITRGWGPVERPRESRLFFISSGTNPMGCRFVGRID